MNKYLPKYQMLETNSKRITKFQISNSRGSKWLTTKTREVKSGMLQLKLKGPKNLFPFFIFLRLLMWQWWLKGPKNLHCVPLVLLADAAVEAQKFQNYSSITINHQSLKLTPCLTLTSSTEFSSAQPQHITRYALLCLGLLLILIPALIHVMTIKSSSKNGNRIESSGEITLWTKASCLTMWSDVIISQELVHCSAKIS